jgi:endonuclease/exonuclease/phosphatase family metal-dependent hydrolase
MHSKKLLLGICLSVLLATNSLNCLAQQIAINVLTYNIRFSNPDDGDNYWPKRSEAVLSMVAEQQPDVFGLQEALLSQVQDFEKAFKGFHRAGVGRDDGKAGGEFSPIFYNAAKFTCLASGTLWLSQTPAIAGSRGWDAACNRVLTWVRLHQKETSKTFVVFNTHFDHMGQVARQQSAHLILRSVDSLANGLPSIVMGDFNALPDSEPVRLLTAPGQLVDSRTLYANPEGPNYTFTGFEVTEKEGELIDYIFVKGIQHINLHKVIVAKRGQYYLSDHLPVLATLGL